MTARPSPKAAKKDVIYVDIEDDITSIIEKVKHASSSIVALVPPKRIGALRSVVNLKLLQRAAETANKRLVMITSDGGLTALAAGVAMPVARNLQSKPELPDVAPEPVEDEDVINGEEVVSKDAGALPEDSEIDKIAVVDFAANASSGSKLSKSRVPNFESFRNKAALIGLAVISIVALLIWAIFFAPNAHVTITAKSVPYSVNKVLTASAGSQLDAEAGVLSAVSKQVAKTASVDFQATGKKEVGEKATGQVKFTRQSLVSTTVAAGTELETSGGLVFITDSQVVVPPSTVGGIGCFPTACPGTANVAVTAAERGTKYNAASGPVSGAPDGVSSSLVGATSGGTDKTVSVVSEQDALAAREKISSQDIESIKAELKKQFSSDMVLVNESFVAEQGSPVVVPAVGEEATAAKLSIETKYSMIGFKRTDLGTILDKDLKRQIAGVPNQSVYDKGLDAIRFANFSKEDKNFKVTAQTTGYIGPLIDSVKLAKDLAGKREGEIIAKVKTYEGIESVDVRFSPFWVSTAPSQDKIIIKFQISNAKN